MTRRVDLTEAQAEATAAAVTSVLKAKRAALARIMDERYARRGRRQPDVAAWRQDEANELIRRIVALEEVINLLDDPGALTGPPAPD